MPEANKGWGSAGFPPVNTLPRSAVLAITDSCLREAVIRELRLLRWTVREAAGAAELFFLLEAQPAAAAILDGWLPDLDFGECVDELRAQFPALPLLSVDGTSLAEAPLKGAMRSELLHALRQSQSVADVANDLVCGLAAEKGPGVREQGLAVPTVVQTRPGIAAGAAQSLPQNHSSGETEGTVWDPEPEAGEPGLPEFVGADPRMLEVSRRIRLVAHRRTAVLVHGETGTGKELVARALHRLSGRPADKFMAINCAAIPEALVESELFGYARGAFTGAVQHRVGRIEAASGGTLFLDEVGELPLTVQSKLLRFLESGEVQRVGENETVRVDARVVAATHRKLGAMAADGSFRVDLLHRLSVFLIQTPPLAGRHGDIDALLDHALRSLGKEEPAKQLSAGARAKLHAHRWPGNVRELEHTLERAWILSGTSAVIDEACVDFGEALR